MLRGISRTSSIIRSRPTPASRSTSKRQLRTGGRPWPKTPARPRQSTGANCSGHCEITDINNPDAHQTFDCNSNCNCDHLDQPGVPEIIVTDNCTVYPERTGTR